MLARLWANQVEEGKKTVDDIPDKLKEEVYNILIKEGYFENG